MIHIDQHIGVAGAKIHWMRTPNGKWYWCRMAIAIMGSFNMTDEQIRTISPFDPQFNDNYVEGKGRTKQEALKNMEKDMQIISDCIWAV